MTDKGDGRWNDGETCKHALYYSAAPPLQLPGPPTPQHWRTHPPPSPPRRGLFQRAQEVKQGDPERTRSLFERATSLSLPPKKMRLLFKRWLEYEKRHGDGASVEHVKRRALAFVEGAVRAGTA